MKVNEDKEHDEALRPPVEVGDRFQVGTELISGEIMWGTIQTVRALASDGTPYYCPKWAKKDKMPDFWRTPPGASTEQETET